MLHREYPRGVSRCGSRGTWCARKASGGRLSVWASGTRGTLGRYLGGISRIGHSGHMANSKGFRRDSPGWGHSGRRILDQWLRLISQFRPGELDRVALAVGLEIDGWDGSASSDRAIRRATLAVGSGLDGRDLLRGGFLLHRQGDGELGLRRSSPAELVGARPTD